jgi:hypothetical protein
MKRRALAATAAAMAVAAGCAGQPGDLSAAAEKVLVPKVQQVRETAADGTYAQLLAKVRQLKALVEKERAAGEVSDSRAAAIDDAADTLVQDARPTPSPTPTPTPSSASPTPTQSSASPTPTQSSASPTPSSSSPSPGTTISIGGVGPH